VKIDRYLDHLYAAISKEFERTQTRNIGRIQTKRRPTRRRSQPTTTAPRPQGVEAHKYDA
jgi:hypothetical protein